ncbi:hypothetical protein RJ640_016566 [Escallonia rubra]|uniref:Peptidase S8/S53 domain-containing protein n=1 Tax=Escallonia rubra TaxID=112253 RepID=A0AA88URD7_9ASTE|nr:hypothetical protein RJ640_016566 [Escallonia rubra]
MGNGAPIYIGIGNQSREAGQPYSLNPKDVEGKYIFCDFKGKYEQICEFKFQITLLGSKPARQIAYSSPRRPCNILTPGVDILAASEPNREGALIRDHSLLMDYKFVSGTSIASPHAVGIAALLKATHQGPISDMTSVTGIPLDSGAGHLKSNKALDPGLV